MTECIIFLYLRVLHEKYIYRHLRTYDSRNSYPITVVKAIKKIRRKGDMYYHAE